MTGVEEDFWERVEEAAKPAGEPAVAGEDDDEYWGRAAQDDIGARQERQPSRPAGTADRRPASTAPNSRGDRSIRTVRRLVAAVAVLIAACAVVIVASAARQAEPSAQRYVGAADLQAGQMLGGLMRRARQEIARQRAQRRAAAAAARQAAQQIARRRVRSQRRGRAKAARRRAGGRARRPAVVSVAPAQRRPAPRAPVPAAGAEFAPAP